MELQAALAEANRQFLPLPADEINFGDCIRWAKMVVRLHPQAEVWECTIQYDDYHAFVKVGEWFYDAECHEGVSDHNQLPFFIRGGECEAQRMNQPRMFPATFDMGEDKEASGVVALYCCTAHRNDHVEETGFEWYSAGVSPLTDEQARCWKCGELLSEVTPPVPNLLRDEGLDHVAKRYVEQGTLLGTIGKVSFYVLDGIVWTWDGQRVSKTDDERSATWIVRWFSNRSRLDLLDQPIQKANA